MRRFRCYDLAIKFFHECQKLKLPDYLKDQLNRASSSTALNLNEGSAKRTVKDQKKFFYIAFGSARESGAVFDLHPKGVSAELKDLHDHLCASIFQLIRKTS